MSQRSMKATEDITVLQMRKKLCRKYNHNLHETVLLQGGQYMDDNLRLSSYRINHGYANIEVKVLRKGKCNCTSCQEISKNVTIKVTSLSTTTNVECTLWDTVKLIKKSVKQAHGIPVSQQKLMFNRVELLDSRPLHTYNLLNHEAGATEIKMELLVVEGPSTLLKKLRNVVRPQQSSIAT